MPRKTKTKSRRSRKTRRNKNRQRKYHMIGCNNKKCSCSCHRRGGSSPIGGFEIKNGGGCFGPLVGSSYSVDKGGNYYDLPQANAYSVGRDMQLKGGSLLPSNLLNFTRQLEYGAQSVYNGLGGYESPTNPAPYVQNKI